MLVSEHVGKGQIFINPKQGGVKWKSLSQSNRIRSTTGSILKKNTVKNYEFIFNQFQAEFGDRGVDTITPEEILSFLTKLTDGTKQTTKRNRYSSLKAFFNFIINSIDPNIKNPCDTPILRKIFKDRKPPPWSIIEKELIDEIIF